MPQNTTINIQLFILVGQVLLLAITIFLTEKHRRSTVNIESSYECDKLYFELTKLMLQHDELLPFYGIGPEEETKEWKETEDSEKKLWIFLVLLVLNHEFIFF